MKGAIITSHGKLTPNYEYIADLRKAKAVYVLFCYLFSTRVVLIVSVFAFFSASSHKSRVMGVDEKKVLLLGAGMVSGPFADFYSKQPKVSSHAKCEKVIVSDSFDCRHRVSSRWTEASG